MHQKQGKCIKIIKNKVIMHSNQIIGNINKHIQILIYGMSYMYLNIGKLHTSKYRPMLWNGVNSFKE